MSDSFYCRNCGSPNHRTDDCTKPPGSFVAPPEPPAAPKAIPKPRRAPEASLAPGQAVLVAVAELDPPRWPGGPPICPAANLPAFADGKELAAFEAASSPGWKVFLKFTCKACGRLHVWAGGHDPAGQSSGNTRSSLHYDEVVAEAAWRFAPLISDPALAAKARRPAGKHFLRDSTVQSIEDRKRAAAAKAHRDVEIPKVERPADPPLNLPKRDKPEPAARRKPAAATDPGQGRMF